MKIEASKVAVRETPDGKVQVSLWTHGTEMVIDLDDDQAVDHLSDVASTLAHIRKRLDGQKG
jgi:hypothetical protein